MNAEKLLKAFLSKSWNEQSLQRLLKYLRHQFRKRETMNCASCRDVFLLVTSCSVGNVHHRHISQCMKFQRLLEFISH